VKSTTLEPGGVAYLSCLNYLGARTAEEYHDALASWVVPITNHLYVDTNRHAQWQVAGLIPERPDESGAVPTIGDGSRDWQGFRLFAHNPHHDIGNDEFFTTSNEYNLWSNADGYAGYEGMDWPTADRHQRITELLQNNNHWTIESTQKAQNDILSIPAREICKILHELWIGVSTHVERQPTTSRDAYTALNLLRVWNGHMDAGRSEPLIFEIWSQHHLYPCLLKRHLKNLLPSDQQEAALPRILELSNYHCDSRILRTLFGNLAQSPDARAIIITTLSSAVADLKERYGPNMRTWRWGQFHVSKLSHMLNGHTSATWDELPAHELSGDFSTVALGAYTPDGIHSVGAGWRTIIDVGNWDNSLQILMPGQSGDPRNQHYDDQSESWYTGGYTAMPFSEQQIASAVKHQTILTPRKP
jgi:penicillin amidase